MIITLIRFGKYLEVNCQGNDDEESNEKIGQSSGKNAQLYEKNRNKNPGKEFRSEIS
jgi:hypothetical protein